MHSCEEYPDCIQGHAKIKINNNKQTNKHPESCDISIFQTKLFLGCIIVVLLSVADSDVFTLEYSFTALSCYSFKC